MLIHDMLLSLLFLFISFPINGRDRPMVSGDILTFFFDILVNYYIISRIIYIHLHFFLCWYEFSTHSQMQEIV